MRAQRLLVRLAERRQRDGVDEVDGLRLVDRTLLVLDQRDQLVRLHGGVRTSYDDRLDRLAPLLVRHADDSDLGHSGMRPDDVLDLAREDVEATGHDHVLLAVDDRQEPVGVLAGDVTGVQPAALEGLFRLLRLVPVALHDERPADADLAGLAVRHLVEVLVEERDLQPRHRPPARREPRRVARVVLVLLQHRDRHAALGLAEELEEDRAELADRLLEPRRRHGGGAVVDGLERGQVVVGELRVVEQDVEHRRHEHCRGDLVLLDRLQHGRRLEPGQHHDRPAAQQRRHEERRTRVRERRRDEEARVLGPLPLRHLDLAQRRAGPVGLHDALRLAGRATGVGEPADVLGIDRRRAQGLGLEPLRQLDQVGAHLGRPEREQRLQPGHPLAELGRPLLERRRVVDERLDAGVLEHVGLVLDRPHGVQRRAPAGVEHVGAHGEQHLGAVLAEHRDRVVLANAERGVGLHVAAHLRRHIGRRQNGVAEVDRGLVGMPVERGDEEVGHERRTVQIDRQISRCSHAGTISERVSETLQRLGGRPVQLSLGLPNFGRWAGPDPRALPDLAAAADAAGVDRLVVSDHVVLGHNTDAYRWGRFPTAPDGPWLEPLTCLTAFAAVTRRVRLSTGILIAPLRLPTVLAKTVATIDVLSGGRVDLGVGVGWQREEYDATGVDFSRRGDLLDASIAACRELWTALPASYDGDGDGITFRDVYCSPLPAQARLPVWFSGTLTDRAVRRVSELGDGWIPIMGASVDDIRSGAKRLRDATERPLDIQAPLVPVRRDDRSVDLDAMLGQIPEFAAAGVTNVYVNAATVAASPAQAGEALPGLVEAFRRTVTT